MKNRIYQEHHARNFQEMQELRRICCKQRNCCKHPIESDLRIDEHSMHQRENLSTVSQLLTQIQDVQNKVNSIT